MPKRQKRVVKAVTESKKPLFETVKFVVRLALLVGLPIVVANLAKLEGDWAVVVGQILPVVLPILDKWVHEDSRIPFKGVAPF